MTSTRFVVAVLGSSGNLGSTLMQRHEPSLFDLWPVSRSKNVKKGFYISSKNEISHTEGLVPDLIVNLSNYYSPLESKDEIARMESAILGTAKMLARSILVNRVPVISASTYLQYAPESLRPWSRYAEFKQVAQEKLIAASLSAESNFVDFVLYDNYGGKRRGKFVDQVFDSLENGKTLNSTPGEQILNLTHIYDIADSFLKQIRLLLENVKPESQILELKSNYTRTLREIVREIQKRANLDLKVNWGGLNYREREVFESWTTGLLAPSWWLPKNDFISWVRSSNINGKTCD